MIALKREARALDWAVATAEGGDQSCFEAGDHFGDPEDSCGKSPACPLEKVDREEHKSHHTASAVAVEVARLAEVAYSPEIEPLEPTASHDRPDCSACRTEVDELPPPHSYLCLVLAS